MRGCCDASCGNGGPSTEGDDFAHLKYTRNGRDHGNLAAPLSANWKPPSHCALNGLGVLCLGMCCRRFTASSRTKQCVQRTLLFGTIFFKDSIVRWAQGGGLFQLCMFEAKISSALLALEDLSLKKNPAPLALG